MRITPGVLIEAFPFEIEDASEVVILLFPMFSAAKFSNSDLDGPDPLETIEPPCASSPTHMSCVRLSTANIACETRPKPESRFFMQLEITTGGKSNRLSTGNPTATRRGDCGKCIGREAAPADI